MAAPAVPIPANLRASAQDRENGELRAWASRLPDLVAMLADRWSLQLGEPYEPGGHCSWVAPARGRDGEDLVLKLGWRHPDTEHEADALRAWAGSGSVLLHAAETFDSTSALLLERCIPGDPLSTLPEPEQDVVVAGLLRRLWAQPVDPQPFRPLGQMCEDWAAEFEEELAASSEPVDPGLAREAMTLFRELPGSAADTVLLCTDLHAGNVLVAEREPWLAVDPNPYVGDPAYDALQHMLNCTERLHEDPVAFAGRMAALLELDPERLRLWLFARCVQECLGEPELSEIAVRIAP